MPEPRAPCVFVEEAAFRAPAIAGVPTAIAGFVGAARSGPTTPRAITSLADFERVHGDGAPLVFGGERVDNALWHAVRAFFANGGRQLVVARVFRPLSPTDDGRARAMVPGAFALAARHPGAAGNGPVQFTFALGPDCLVQTAGGLSLDGVGEGDLVLVDGAGFRSLVRGAGGRWQLKPARGRAQDLRAGMVVRRLGVTLSCQGVVVAGPGIAAALAQFGPDADAAMPLLITARRRVTGLGLLAAFRQLHAAQHGSPDAFARALCDPASLDEARSVVIPLTGGNDGLEPTAQTIIGSAQPPTGLAALAAVADITIVAAPGATRHDTPDARASMAALIAHAERLRTCIAVVDSVRGHSLAEVRALRAQYDGSHAAFYYPWVRLQDPVTGTDILQPPSGFVAGIYARTDLERGVWKAPANAVVQLATGFEAMITYAQQEVLNPDGINCFRAFEGRGLRLWGARTLSRDPEWKYVNVRRYFAYLERSIVAGTQWAVFEPNGDALWARLRTTVSDFLFSEWRGGALIGSKPEEAFFVRCDRSTMDQTDLDAGRLVCLVGVAMVKPAEFTILRVGQWTADRTV